MRMWMRQQPSVLLVAGDGLVGAMVGRAEGVAVGRDVATWVGKNRTSELENKEIPFFSLIRFVKLYFNKYNTRAFRPARVVANLGVGGGRFGSRAR